MKRVFFLVWGLFMFVLSLSIYAENVVFNNPQVEGYGLDYCREWSANCGLPAATAFCQSKGYPKAVDFEWAADNQKTRVISSGQVCDAASCDRITKVVCESQTVTFNNPQVEGYGLDYCREWSANCGLPAATAFCQSKGYPKAVDFEWAADNQKTRVISSGQVCDAASCDRITKVVCDAKRTMTFNNPQVNGYGLDYCREWSANCGLPAATAFCESKGYSKAVNFEWVADKQKTRVISSGQVCDAASCDRITKVVCE